jgi:TetR/AcrR family transcriptional repressor of nem operon
LLDGDIWEWSCYVGTTIQETHETHPELRAACAESIEQHLLMLRALIDDALREQKAPGVDPASLAVHIQAVIQGAFIMAKARQDRQAASEAIEHLIRYVELLFSRSTRRKRKRQE